MAAWPPLLPALKLDMGIAVDDTRDDTRLQTQLDAAISFVERIRPRFNYDEDPESTCPAPTDDLVLGTLRLAARWHTRRRSPQGLVDMGELGTARIPSFDPDIDRLLRIGRHAIPAVG